MSGRVNKRARDGDGLDELGDEFGLHQDKISWNEWPYRGDQRDVRSQRP